MNTTPTPAPAPNMVSFADKYPYKPLGMSYGAYIKS